jgi:hypothetical protein
MFSFQEKITGVILVQSGSDVKHDGISLTMEGTVNLQLSAKNVGIFEAFYNSVKVRFVPVLIKLFSTSLQIIVFVTLSEWRSKSVA